MADDEQLFRDGAFVGRTVFVAGGSSGINLGIAERFAAISARVALISRNAQRIEAAAGCSRHMPAPPRPASTI